MRTTEHEFSEADCVKAVETFRSELLASRSEEEIDFIWKEIWSATKSSPRWPQTLTHLLLSSMATLLSRPLPNFGNQPQPYEYFAVLGLRLAEEQVGSEAGRSISKEEIAPIYELLLWANLLSVYDHYPGIAGSLLREKLPELLVTHMPALNEVAYRMGRSDSSRPGGLARQQDAIKTRDLVVKDVIAGLEVGRWKKQVDAVDDLLPKYFPDPGPEEDVWERMRRYVAQGFKQYEKRQSCR